MEKKYWKTINEMGLPSDKTAEIVSQNQDSGVLEMLSDDLNEKSASRRNFLKWCGISFVSATVVSACENPVKKAIPYIIQPEQLTPGKATWYASSYAQGNEYCSILVKTRDGRPIKIEGNTMSSINGGGTTARVQGSVLSLYDDGARYKAPMKNGVKIDWPTADAEIMKALDEMQANGEKMVMVTPTIISPSTKKLIAELQNRYSELEVVAYDAISYSAIRQAHGRTHKLEIIPDYRFDKAEVIVSFSADFLGTWLAPAVFAHRYSKTRKLDPDNPKMSHHVQFEANMSITGSNADERVPVKPGEELNILHALYNELETGSPRTSLAGVDYSVKKLADKLKQHKGKCLVVSGHNNLAIQMMVNAINHKLESYGNTLQTNAAIMAGNDNSKRFNELVGEMEKGRVGAVLFYQTNPLFTFPDASRMKAAIEKTALTISFATAKDETSKICNYILPDNHYLESWNDAEFIAGHYSLSQPAIRKLFDTRQFQDTLIAWLGKSEDFYQYLKKNWEENMLAKQSQFSSFSSFWHQSLQSGVFESAAVETQIPAFDAESLSSLSRDISKIVADAGQIEFTLVQNIPMGDGSHANNPWLQELPDPVTSITWDNFIAISPAFASEKGFKTGDIVKLNNLISLPVYVQPGQAKGSVSIALGYGRSYAGKAGDKVGANVFPLASFAGSDFSFTGKVTDLEKIGSGHQFAMTQTHHLMEGRPIVRESTLDKYKENKYAGNEIRKYHKKHMSTLYPEMKFPGHHWALVVDLNACVGCSNCVIACQSENNVPVVGKDEVRRRRIMHWMRIDRYYNGDAENPEIVFQPVMCQHCDNAPCENVCPVTATNHSDEGINQMAYNRCVGTKYCINNCPYKVRRFNWFRYAQNDKFDYNMNTDMGRMVLNPDVTVRERGVVEKCSFCIQRIQEGKLNAKNEKRALRDGEIKTACVQSCPTNALYFGDLNDKNSMVAKLIKDSRNYHILEEYHTLPSVGYLTKIRNKEI
jgi:Fe-S-cluster-containing dehydrogenase component/anaerobic selenocysteine-containing dehydrogenase